MRRGWFALVLLTAACSATDAGPDAPAPGAVESACSAEACAAIPDDWSVEIGEDFVSFTHPIDPQRVLGTVGGVDMQGIIAASGGTWPAEPEAVVRAFFDLLGETQRADLAQVVTNADGSVTGSGRLEDLRIWYRLIPVDGAVAVGVEVRAPNASWREHAELILDGVRVVPG